MRAEQSFTIFWLTAFLIHPKTLRIYTMVGELGELFVSVLKPLTEKDIPQRMKPITSQ